MKTQLICPCSVQIKGVDEDDLVAKVQEHLTEVHPGRMYDREMILLMAT